MHFFIGTSGWTYPEWRGVLYPAGLSAKDHLAFASRKLSSIELNASFYRLLKPHDFISWYCELPKNFKMSVKAGRFITHTLQVKDCDTAMANFFASGILALKEKLGPILWQLPPQLHYSQHVLDFIQKLPQSFDQASLLASQHTDKVKGRSLTHVNFKGPMNHVIECRHNSFLDDEFINMARDHGIAIAMVENGDLGPHIHEVTANFLYFRCHAPKALYPEGYGKSSLESILKDVTSLARQYKIKEVFIYFDNENKVTAPVNALSTMLLASDIIGKDLG